MHLRNHALLSLSFLALGSCAQINRSESVKAKDSKTFAKDIESLPDLQDTRPLNLGKRNLQNISHFDWPVDEARLTRGFKPAVKRGRRPHLGIDLAAPAGTTILSSNDGTVIYVGKSFKGYGRMIMVQSKNGWATLYAHLSKTFVREGQRVLQGEKIGGMGKTGRAFGVHLHFEIRTPKGPVDPLYYLPHGALVSQVSKN